MLGLLNCMLPEFIDLAVSFCLVFLGPLSYGSCIVACAFKWLEIVQKQHRSYLTIE